MTWAEKEKKAQELWKTIETWKPFIIRMIGSTVEISPEDWLDIFQIMLGILKEKIRKHEAI